MKKWIIAAIAASALSWGVAAGGAAGVTAVVGNDSIAERDSGATWCWGFLGSIEMGGHFVGGAGLDAVEAAGYGSVSRDSVVALFSAGCFIRKPGIVDVSLLVSYLGGGSYVWDDLFGDSNSSFSLYADSLAAQLEVKPTFGFLGGVRPFIGAGYSITNGLVDEYGDGFARGRGPFVVGGLDLVSLFGPSFPLFSDDGKGFVSLRASVYYRPSFSYEFKLDWDEFAVNYFGAAPLDELKAFFTRQFAADALSFGIGLSIAYAPYRFGD